MDNRQLSELILAKAQGGHAHNESIGSEQISSRPFGTRIALRVQMPRCRKSQLRVCPRGYAIVRAIRYALDYMIAHE